MSGVVWQSSLSASQSTASQKAVAHISMRLQYFLGEASIKASQPISQVSRRQLLTSVQLRHDKVTSCHFVGEIGIGFLAKDGKPFGLRSRTILGPFGQVKSALDSAEYLKKPIPC